MHITEDIKEIVNIPGNLLDNFVSTCLEVNWQLDDFTRKEVSLVEGRMCIIPCIIARAEQLVNTPARKRLWLGVNPIVTFVQNLFPNFKMVRGEIVNLTPGKSLTPHVDIHWFHKESKRIHIPVVSNTESCLTFEGRPYQLKPGKVYEINNRIMHSGFNHGTTDRVHVIIDLMPEDIFSQAINSKQDFMEKL
jgi:hypothetical protein